jgi:hypothetical protein
VIAIAVVSIVFSGPGVHAATVLRGGGTANAAVLGSGSASENAVSATTGFTVTGSVAGLYPGVTKLLVLTIFNPQKVTITVFYVSTTVSTPSLACTSANLSVSTFTAHKAVRAKKTGVIAVYAKMAHSAPNACQGQVFHLRFFAKATAP